MTQTIELPLIEGGDVFGPSFGQPQTIHLPLIEGGAVFAPTIVPEGAPTLEVLVNGDPLEGTFRRRFEDVFGDVGRFSFQMDREDYLDTTPVDFDDIITIKVNGVARFAGFVETIDHDTLTSSGDPTVEFGGRGILAKLDTPKVVYPSRGIRSLPIEDVRTLSWVGADYDPAAAGWKHPKIVNHQRSYAATGAPRPSIWPDTTGRWIGPNLPSVTSFDAPQGITLYRHDFELDATKLTRHFLGADAVLRAWIDGAEQTWFAGAAGRYIEIELGPGTHNIAVKVANNVDVPGEDNPTGLIGVGYTVGSDGLLDEKLYETDTSWYHLPYPVRAPGFSDGKAIRLLFADSNVTDWQRVFTDSVDTAGRPWAYQREVSANVGRSLLEFLRERSDARIDVAAAPGSLPGALKLRAWNRGTRGVVRNSVVLVQTDDPETSDFVSLRHSGLRARQNTLLIRTAEGHTEANDQDSIDDLGERGGYLELGHFTDEDEAIDVAEIQMENRSEPSWSTKGTLDPRSTATTPYDAFEVADWIWCPNELDDNELMRVRSIILEEDEEGEITWPITLRNRQLEEEERIRAWLRRSADGFLIGGARVASRAGTPAPTVQQITVLKVAEFSDGNGLISSLPEWSVKRPAEQSSNIVQVYGQLTTAGTSTTAIEVYLDGDLLTTLNWSAGETEDVKAISIVPVIANAGKLQLRKLLAGTGAAGLDVQVRGI